MKYQVLVLAALRLRLYCQYQVKAEKRFLFALQYLPMRSYRTPHSPSELEVDQQDLVIGYSFCLPMGFVDISQILF